ncbi:MAG TPA: site-2 protease family protein [Anaerolineales bacterium]
MYNPRFMIGLSPLELVARAVTLVIALTVHEFSHAWTADQLGDDTPRAHGRLTLNPLAHLDPIGSLMMLIAGFGWAKPVPVNPFALSRRTPAGLMLVAAAGPLSNLVLAILAAIPFRAGWINAASLSGFAATWPMLLAEFIFLNLILLFFNLLPIYPLDGEKVAEYFLPVQAREVLYRLRPFGFVIILGLVFLGRTGLNVLGWLVSAPASTVFSLLVT